MKNVLAWIFPLYAVGLLAIVILALQTPLAPEPDIRRMDWRHYHQRLQIETIQPTLPRPVFSKLDAGRERKAAFIDYFLPLVRANNDKVTKQRVFVLKMQNKVERGEAITRRENKIVSILNKEFKVKSESLPIQIETLVSRVNVIPESMALAQGAIESAWGSSRFARKGNNFFGQWCYKKGCGIVPNKRASHAKHEVAAFSSPAESVAAYFTNINTHRAYRALRQTRLNMAEQNLPIKPRPLVQQLGQYSERGDAYIKDVLALINFNDLDELAEI